MERIYARANQQLVKRRAAFKKALVDEGTTVTAFAERLGITPQSLNRAFRNPRSVSRRVHDVIDRFIAKHANAA